MTMADKVGKIEGKAKAPKQKAPRQKGAGFKGLLPSKGPVADTVSSDEYGNGRTMDESQAHRDVVYEPAGTFQQMITVYTTQMKRFFRERSFWLLIGLILAVPIGVMVMEPLDLVRSDVANTFMAAALMLAPVICALVASLTCGSMLPQEFNERTAFLSMPLPMSRVTFYIGKFLAGLSLSLAVILAAYGLAILSSAAVSDVTYTPSIGSSILVAVASMFSYCCIAYLLSVFTKRSATMMSLVFLAAVLPLIFILLGFAIPSDALGYAPCFGFDLSVMMLGQPPFGMVASVMGFLGTNAPFSVGGSPSVMAAVAVVFGIICLVLGMIKVNRRDM